MKNALIFLLLVVTFHGYSQLKPAVLKLADQNEIQVMGKMKSNNFFKYKIEGSRKAKKVHFSKIEYVKMNNANDEMKSFKYFEVKNASEGVVVEEMEIGSKANLYAVINNGYIRQGGFTVPVTSVFYYVKKAEEKELTRLGNYDPLRNNLKKKIIDFYSDCEELIQKINRKDLKVKSDVVKIARFYNTHCTE